MNAYRWKRTLLPVLIKQTVPGSLPYKENTLVFTGEHNVVQINLINSNFSFAVCCSIYIMFILFAQTTVYLYHRLPI